MNCEFSLCGNQNSIAMNSTILLIFPKFRRCHLVSLFLPSSTTTEKDKFKKHWTKIEKELDKLGNSHLIQIAKEVKIMEVTFHKNICRCENQDETFTSTSKISKSQSIKSHSNSLKRFTYDSQIFFFLSVEAKIKGMIF